MNSGCCPGSASSPESATCSASFLPSQSLSQEPNVAFGAPGDASLPSLFISVDMMIINLFFAKLEWDLDIGVYTVATVVGIYRCWPLILMVPSPRNFCKTRFWHFSSPSSSREISHPQEKDSNSWLYVSKGVAGSNS